MGEGELETREQNGMQLLQSFEQRCLNYCSPVSIVSGKIRICPVRDFVVTLRPSVLSILLIEYRRVFGFIDTGGHWKGSVE